MENGKWSIEHNHGLLEIPGLSTSFDVEFSVGQFSAYLTFFEDIPSDVEMQMQTPCTLLLIPRQ